MGIRSLLILAKKKKKKKSSIIITFWRTHWSSAQSVNLYEVSVSDRVTLPESGLFTLHSGFFSPRLQSSLLLELLRTEDVFFNFLDIS